MTRPVDGVWPDPTPEQAALIAEVDAKVAAIARPALERFKELSWIYSMACKLSLRDLIRLNQILRRLDDSDLKRVAAFAEGLAEWSSGDASSADG